MDNKRIVCRVVNGEMVPVSDDPIQIIEDVCIKRTGELRFTPAKEMNAYDEIIEKSAHAEKFKLRLMRESAGLSYDAIFLRHDPLIQPHEVRILSAQTVHHENRD